MARTSCEEATCWCLASSSYLVATIWLTEAKSRVPRRVAAQEPIWLHTNPNTAPCSGVLMSNPSWLVWLKSFNAIQPNAQAGPGARGGDLAGGQPPGDSFDETQLRANDLQVRHRKASAGKVVHSLQGVGIALVDSQGHGKFQVYAGGVAQLASYHARSCSEVVCGAVCLNSRRLTVIQRAPYLLVLARA